MESITLLDFALLTGVLAVAGLVMGAVAGLFGIGGGGVLVPVLYEVFGAIGVDEAVRIHLSVGTSLAIIVPTSLRSYFSHRESGKVDSRIVALMAVPVVLGVGLGAIVAWIADAAVLKGVWAIVGALLSIKFLFARDSWRLGTELPGALWLRVYGVFVGAVSTLMSIGGGAFVTMLLTLFGRSIHQGVATASAFGPLIALPGVLGFIWAGWGVDGLPPGSLGYVSLLGAAAIVPTSVFAAPFGARLGHRWSRRKLEVAFGVFVGLVALRFAVSLWSGSS